MKLQLQNLSLQYNNKASLFQNVNLTIESGDFVIIKGPSGSGKSSLLRLINRLQEPTGGTLLIDDKTLTDYDVTQIRRRIGYVQQTPVVFDDTVRNNLLLPFTYKTASEITKPNDTVLQEKLTAYLLKDISLDDRALELSVGQKQRLALIRTLLVNPESRTIVERELEHINQTAQVTIILVTHIDFSTQEITPKTYTLTPNGLT
jgi:putative ABC transport system ATP-binding protein